MSQLANIDGYQYEDSGTNCSHAYLLPAVRSELAELFPTLRSDVAQPRLFDLGCGNGSVAAKLSEDGWDVAGVDPSSEGIAQANASYPDLKLECGSAYDDLSGKWGTFPVIVSLEVVEHVYAPRDYAKTLFDLCEPGGTVVISTPYHGYLKNLALALSGKMDRHFTALWDHGHIKFWSRSTLSTLLEEAGFEAPRYLRVGRIPPLAKSMIAIARRP